MCAFGRHIAMAAANIFHVVGWVERSETHRILRNGIDEFRSLTLASAFGGCSTILRAACDRMNP
jgi:hypothetical protein